MTSLPSVGEVLADAVVVSLPMRVRFRGITTREALLLRGPAGWGEFAPFPEYADDEAAHWLQSAIEDAWLGPPPAVRTRYRSTRPSPPSTPPGCPTCSRGTPVHGPRK